MSTQPEISQRDLRLRSKEIMDSVERGHSYTITRDGREIGELVPLRRRRRFVPREEFLSGWQAGPVDTDRFRADLDTATDPNVIDPFER